MKASLRLVTTSIGIAAVTSGAFAQSFNFDNPVTLAGSQTAGAWYTDRYAPAGFVSPVSFDGGNRLKQSISAADGANNRPGSFSSAFYNTQGRKYDLNANTTKMSIDLYVSSDWASTGRRMAGFWGTAFDPSSSVSFYPILEFTSDSNTPRFRAYNNGVWVDLGLPTGFSYNTWQNLSVELTGGNFVYTVGDLTTSVNALGSSTIGNVILQGHNTTEGVDYDIYWDNFQAVPEPATMAILGIGALAVLRRRKKA